MSGAAPAVLFGAFDRHNLGDILLAHVAERETDRPVRFAGLARRDLRPWGGHAVEPLAEIAAGWRACHGDAPLELIHVGGELLDCDLLQAAVMLCDPAAAKDAAARWDDDARGRQWAADFLGVRRRLPYAVAARSLPGGRTVFRAVGGVGLAGRDAAFRDEALATLRQSSRLSVRDRETRRILAAAGIAADLEPDPVTRIAALCGDRIRLPGGAPYVAMQFAAECGDDATLDAFARGVLRLAERHGADIVLFRAGVAPWHDDPEPYRRLVARLGPRCRIFDSLDVWDICGLIAGARACAATSLHVRIVATAWGVPAVSLEREAGAGRKLRAYLETWEEGAAVLAPGEFAAGAF